MAGSRKDRGLYDGRNVSGARMWLEVGATEDSMLEALYKEQGCGWRKEKQRIVWRQCVRSNGLAGGRRDKELYDVCNV